VDIRARTYLVVNGKTVTTRQLEVLEKVRAGGSMTAAAEDLGISAPAVHKYMCQIEEAAGVPIYVSAPSGTRLTAAGREIADTFAAMELRSRTERKFTICCSPVTEDLMMSVMSALRMTDSELIISDDENNLRMMKEHMADYAVLDDPMYLFEAEEFEWMEIGYMGMVLVDNGSSFIRYRYGAQRVAYMYLDSIDREYTVDSVTYSLPELLGSNKSFFIDEFLLQRKGLRLKSAVDPKMLRHTINAIYRKETEQISKLNRALISRRVE
jgi:molybdate transport repressor ModE-like protein